jgi:DNA polymerase-3 subunit delta'
MSDTAATAPLAPWIAAQRTRLLAQRGHAWLLQGPSGLGQYALGLAMVRAWLCDRPTAEGACGQCGSCHAIDVRTHADLCVLMPEVQMIALGWPLSEKAQADIDDKKRKASREIRVEAMRDAVEFSQRTSARGRGKAVLVYPAEQMNHITANALLKTLEEPPGDVRFVLASEAAHQLLPTIRSRCLGHTMVWPAEAEMLAWLEGQGIAADAAPAFLRAAGGRPDDALALARSGRSPQAWALLPQAVARGPPLFRPGRPAQAPAAGAADALVQGPGQGGTHGRSPLQRRPDAGGACRPGAKRPTLTAIKPPHTHEQSFHRPPPQRHAAGHQGKGGPVCGLHPLFRGRGHLCAHPARLQAGG